MRRLVPIAVIVAALVLTPATACKRKRPPAAQPNSGAAGQQPQQPGSSEPATMLATSDPRAAIQLTKGFYDLENGGWRWSAKDFAASLKPPAGAAQKGASLVLKFSLIDAVTEKLGPITLSAKAGGAGLPAKTYPKAGAYEYRADVPPSAFAQGQTMTTVEFSLDKALAPTPNDNRELGLVVSIVGFEAK